jgi:hypothetical protein
MPSPLPELSVLAATHACGLQQHVIYVTYVIYVARQTKTMQSKSNQFDSNQFDSMQCCCKPRRYGAKKKLRGVRSFYMG